MGKPAESFEELVENEVRVARGRYGLERPADELTEAEEVKPGEVPKELVDLVKPIGKIDTAWFGIHGYILDVQSTSCSDARLSQDALKKLVASKHFRWLSPSGDTGYHLGLTHDKPAGEWAR